MTIYNEKELIGNINTLGKLRDIWHDLTQLMSKMGIHRDNWGIDRDREIFFKPYNPIPEYVYKLER